MKLIYITCTALGLIAMALLYRIWGSMSGPALRLGMGANYQHCTVPSTDGAKPLADYRGSVILLVNTASRCGYTQQYRELEALWTTYRERGLIIIALPTNDFLHQEPGSDADIAGFCQMNFGVSFPLMLKTSTRGSAAADIYRQLCSDPNLGGAIRWNFEKCIFDRQGRLRARIAPRVSPQDPRCVNILENLLNEAGDAPRAKESHPHL
jgi:glutathione peroxidase